MLYWIRKSGQAKAERISRYAYGGEDFVLEQAKVSEEWKVKSEEWRVKSEEGKVKSEKRKMKREKQKDGPKLDLEWPPAPWKGERKGDSEGQTTFKSPFQGVGGQKKQSCA